MRTSKFVRTLSALLMLFAILLPAAPAGAQVVNDDQDQVSAANVGGPIINPPYTNPGVPSIDVQDCTGSQQLTNVGLSRYFATVRSTSGLDITNAVGCLVPISSTGLVLPAPFNTAGQSAGPVTMSNGDFESQANDGTPPACVPAVNDGHANDLASPPVQTVPVVAPPIAIPGLPAPGTALWYMVITAAGFQPAVIPLVADATTPPCTIDAQVPPVNVNAGRVCLISIGTVNLVPLSAPAGRGTIAGSIFGSNGSPLDGATVAVIDASGLTHTRISGTRCDGSPVGGAVPTGFYCVEDSTGDKPTTPAATPPNGGPLPSPFGFVDDGLGPRLARPRSPW